ncbi:lysosomal phospholipase A and acyltransferase-like isoform X1 [Haliotis cracherodii]|uniref:lysosomal phospholipase A and acyltransferase-like isoform X1 n=1 Tax=Haliotis cracherodii TaxID=6455 RepID=UPI0039E785DA
MVDMEKMGSRFLLLCVIICELTTLLEARYPVVLVPGDGGSQFLAKLNKSTGPHEFCQQKTSYYFNLWLNLEELAPYVIDCFVDNMKLHYNSTSHTTSNTPGVDIVIPGFGNTSSVEWLDPDYYVHFSSTSYFAPIVEALVKWGYKRGESVRGAPYDFRKAPNEFDVFYKNLTSLVEDTYVRNNNTKVVLIAHSMGNPTTLYFLNHRPQVWKDKYLHCFITISGVWGGAVKPLRLFSAGDNLNVPFVEGINVREEQRSMPSSAFLMPSEKFWAANEVLVSQPKRNYTVKDYKAFFTDLGIPNAYLMRQDTENLVKDLIPPGVEIHCLHGVKMPTPLQFIFGEGMWPDKQPKVVTGNGDGTVNIRSLHGCLSWQGKQKQKIYHKEFPKAEHTEILSNKDVLAYIKTVVNS